MLVNIEDIVLQAINLWMEKLKHVKNYSDHTLTAYINDLNSFLEFVGKFYND